jgi:predicted TIM-barrel fold metal-dependent hydrolase
MSPQAIDLHAHWLPPVMAEALRQRHKQVPRIDTFADGSEQMVMPTGTLTFSADYTAASQRLAHMDRMGVGKQMLSLPGLFGIDGLPLDQSAPLVRIFNDACAGLCQAYPERFCGLAALPWVNLDAAVAELRHARLKLGLLGAILPVEAFHCEASAARLLPLFEAAEDLGALFFVHPGRMPGSSALPLTSPDHDWTRQALAVQHDVGQAMVTLLLSDFLRPWRNIAVQVAHLGGSFAAVVERMDPMQSLRDPTRALPSRRTRAVWVDCSSLSPRTLEQAVAVFGADRVVLGTDGPVGDASKTISAIRHSRLSTADQALILQGNAAGLLARFS